MLEFLERLFGKPGRASAAPASARIADDVHESGQRANPQNIGTRRSLAKMSAKSLAFGTEGGKYRRFEARSDAGIRRLLGCGPCLNVDGTPMVGDTGFDERGRPYGVTEDFG